MTKKILYIQIYLANKAKKLALVLLRFLLIIITNIKVVFTIVFTIINFTISFKASTTNNYLLFKYMLCIYYLV